MKWWNLLRIGKCKLKNIAGNFWIIHILREILSIFFLKSMYVD